MKSHIKLFILLLSWPPNLIANWNIGVWVDDFDDSKTKYTYTTSKTETLIVWEGKHSYMGKLIVGKKYSPLSSVPMMRVDKYDAHRIRSVSTTGLRKGTFELQDKMIKEMQLGDNVIFKFCDILDRCYIARFSLAGSNNALCKTLPSLPKYEVLCQKKG